MYIRYQRSKDGRELTGGFYNNLNDILSLASLTVHIDRLLQDPKCGLAAHPLDFYSLGKAYDRASEPEMAAYAYEEALRRGLTGEHRLERLSAFSSLQE